MSELSRAPAGLMNAQTNDTPAGVPDVSNMSAPRLPQNADTPLTPDHKPAPAQPVPVAPVPVAPVAPVAPAPVAPVAPVPAAPTPAAPQGATYLETSVQHFTTELGVSEDAFNAVVEKALEYNDPSLINLNALGTVTPEQAQRATQLAQAVLQETQHKIHAAKQEVYAVVGGEAQWATALGAFNSNAPQDARGYAAYLADQGNLKGCAEYIQNYNQQAGYVNQVQRAPLMGGTGGVQQGMGADEYRQKVGALAIEAGNRSLSQGEYSIKMEQLDRARALGRQQGL